MGYLRLKKETVIKTVSYKLAGEFRPFLFQRFLDLGCISGIDEYLLDRGNSPDVQPEASRDGDEFHPSLRRPSRYYDANYNLSDFIQSFGRLDQGPGVINYSRMTASNLFTLQKTLLHFMHARLLFEMNVTV